MQPGAAAPHGLRPRRQRRLGAVHARPAGARRPREPGRDRRRRDDAARPAARRLGPGFVPENLQADVDGRRQRAPAGAGRAGRHLGCAGQGARARAAARNAASARTSAAGWTWGPSTFACATWGPRCRSQSGIVEISNDGVILHNVRVLLDDQGTLVIGASGVRAGPGPVHQPVPVQAGRVRPAAARRATQPTAARACSRSTTWRSIWTCAATWTRASAGRGGAPGVGALPAGLQGRRTWSSARASTSRRCARSTRASRCWRIWSWICRCARSATGFVVQNNIAPEIHVDVILHVGGTLAVPQLAGDVRPTDGRFNIPFMRGDFDLVPNVNHVTFIATKSIADGDTPDIAIEAVNQVTDANGADHNVRMRIHGPLREAQIDLSSDDGLDRNQTAFLLLTGRTSASTASRVRDAEPDGGREPDHGRRHRRPGHPRHRRQPDGALHRRHVPAADGPQPAPDRRVGRLRRAASASASAATATCSWTTCRGSRTPATGTARAACGWSTTSPSAAASSKSACRRSRAFPRPCPSTTISSCGWITR